MTAQEGLDIVDVPAGQRGGLEWILDESFEGWYLRHSKGTLQDIELVRAAVSSGAPVGLIMTKRLEEGPGYVYYVAVARASRRLGVARLLLGDALEGFRAAGVNEVYAGIEGDNKPSEGLFVSMGFVRTSLAEVSGRYGALHALNMYWAMRVVPGEFLLHKTII